MWDHIEIMGKLKTWAMVSTAVNVTNTVFNIDRGFIMDESCWILGRMFSGHSPGI